MIDTIYSDPNFLKHYGVKGMRWGVRHDEVDKAFRPGPKDKASPAEKITRGSSEINDVLKSSLSRERRSKKKKQTDYSHLSDAELRSRINRLEMEKRYASLTDPGIKRGKAVALDVLDVTGDVLAYAAAAATIGTAIYKIKH